MPYKLCLEKCLPWGLRSIGSNGFSRWTPLASVTLSLETVSGPENTIEDRGYCSDDRTLLIGTKAWGSSPLQPQIGCGDTGDGGRIFACVTITPQEQEKGGSWLPLCCERLRGPALLSSSPAWSWASLPGARLCHEWWWRFRLARPGTCCSVGGRFLVFFYSHLARTSHYVRRPLFICTVFLQGLLYGLADRREYFMKQGS